VAVIGSELRYGMFEARWYIYIYYPPRCPDVVSRFLIGSFFGYCIERERERERERVVGAGTLFIGLVFISAKLFPEVSNDNNRDPIKCLCSNVFAMGLCFFGHVHLFMK
jgi:dolichol kinase